MSKSTCDGISTEVLGGSVVKKSKKVYTTNIKLVVLRQDWIIDNFASLVKLCKPGQCLRSQAFQHTCYEDVNWQLCMYPGGKREENKGFISLFLKMYAPPAKDICLTAEYRLLFLGDDDTVKFSNVNTGEFHSKTGKKGFGWGLRNLPRQKVLQCLRRDGSLAIHCEVNLLPDLSKVACVESLGMKLEGEAKVEVSPGYRDGISSLLESGTLSDFAISCGSKEYLVHKAILAARSEVFRAMFASNMSEAEQSVLQISDFSAEAVELMLQSIYSGEAKLSPNCVDELMGLAEKYGLEELKASCELAFAEKLAVDNVCQAIALADMYLAKGLKSACMSFIASHWKEVKVIKEYAKLKEDYPKLVNEILENMVALDNQGLCSSFSGGAPPPAKVPRMSSY